jgi:hypothetical protein
VESLLVPVKAPRLKICRELYKAADLAKALVAARMNKQKEISCVRRKWSREKIIKYSACSRELR